MNLALVKLFIHSKKMIEIINKGLPFEREVWNRDDAIDYFDNQGELYKSQIIKDLPENEEISIYFIWRNEINKFFFTGFQDRLTISLGLLRYTF